MKWYMISYHIPFHIHKMVYEIIDNISHLKSYTYNII